MLKSTLASLMSVFVLIALLFVIYPVNSQERDWNECLEESDSKWGKECANCMVAKGTYLVSLRNICSEKIDCMVCVQEKYKNWRCYTQLNLEAMDTIYGYACKGAGRYLYWVKQAGDGATTFPTVDEVNGTYAD